MIRSHSDLRTCKECGEGRPLSAFYLNKGVPMGKCKDCVKDAVKARRLVDPSVRAYDRARAKLPHRRDNAARISKAWRAENPLAYKAHTAIGNALRDGKIQREPCAICAATDDIHAHHKDYAMPFDVIWLCARCHLRLHALFPELEGVNKVFAR